MYRHLIALVACCFWSASFAMGAHGTSIKIIAPVKIVTKRDGRATAEILVEMTITNIFDRAARYSTNDFPVFVLFDAAGSYIDTFIVDTNPQKGEEQISVDKDAVVLEPKKSYTRKVKVWVRALAMEPGRCYLLGDDLGQITEKAPFIPIVKDDRQKLRGRIYEQTVRIRTPKSVYCATIFDIDEKKEVAFALTILKDSNEKVEVAPLYYHSQTRPSVLVLYQGGFMKGSVRRAENGIAVIEFPLKVSDRLTLKPNPLPLAKEDYDYKKDTFIGCGWNPSIGVTAPCSVIRGGIINGFSTIYATPREGWKGSGYYSNSGFLVGLCEAPANPEGHDSRLGLYVGLKTLRKALRDVNYKSTPYYDKKRDK